MADVVYPEGDEPYVLVKLHRELSNGQLDVGIFHSGHLNCEGARRLLETAVTMPNDPACT